MEYNARLAPSHVRVGPSHSEEYSKTLKSTTFILKCFRFLDMCYLIAGFILIIMALSNSPTDNGLFMYAGLFGLFAAMSAMCNSLARHGVRVWRRELLVPWLLFYPWILGFLVVNLIHTLYMTNFNLELHQLILITAIFTIFICWKQINKQFTLMGFANPEQGEIHQNYRDYLSTTTGHDLPPKYEEIEDLPPQYDEVSMGPSNEPQVVEEHKDECANK